MNKDVKEFIKFSKKLTRNPLLLILLMIVGLFLYIFFCIRYFTRIPKMLDATFRKAGKKYGSPLKYNHKYSMKNLFQEVKDIIGWFLHYLFLVKKGH